MRRITVVIFFMAVFHNGFSQSRYPVSFKQLKEFEGLYEYANNTTLKLAASPKDTLLYAIINESRYALTPFDKDVFTNNANDKVTFFRDKSKRVMAYSVGRDTFQLISNKVSFPEEMWYPRTKNKNPAYRQPVNFNDGLATADLKNSGLDRDLLEEMTKKIIDRTYPNVHSVLIIKDGKLVFEEYFYEYDRNKLHELRSATKSIISALTGIAIERFYPE